MIGTVYTETKNDIWLIRQGCHNSGKLITPVIELKKYVKKTGKLHMTTTTMAGLKTSLKKL